MKNNLVTMITKEGREIEVMPHMVNTYEKHGATLTRKVIRETPKELLRMPDKTSPLPEMKISEKINSPLPTMEEVKLMPAKGTSEPVKKERKKPVRSKSK
jgi:hypothetical protein